MLTFDCSQRDIDSVVKSDTVVPWGGSAACGFNRTHYRQLEIPLDRYSVFNSNKYEFDNGNTFFSEISFTSVDSTSSFEPVPFSSEDAFGGLGTYGFNIRNPYMPAAIRDAAVAAQGVDLDGDGNMDVGTDSLGRDVFSQIMEGSQVAFLLGISSATLGVGISTILGTIAAFFGGRIDAYLMRQSDLVLMLPTLPLLFIISAFAELKIWHLAVVLGTIGGLGGSVITIKSQALQVKVKPFVDSARITGGSQMKILFSHVLPNVAPLALLFMVFSVTGAIASESVLSFLGLLNIEMSWGLMIYLAQVEGYIFSGLKYWWLILPAGLSVTFLTGGFYLVGRGLDEVFNPRLRKR